MPSKDVGSLTLKEAFEALTLDALRPMSRLIDKDAPTRKSELVPFLTAAMSRPGTVKHLYETLSENNKLAVAEVLHHDHEGLDLDRFESKYGARPVLQTERRHYTALGLFLHHDLAIPRGLRAILESFVPKPPGVELATVDELPEHVPLAVSHWEAPGTSPTKQTLRQRNTALPARREVETLLRLVEAGKLRVSDKTQKPGKSTVDQIREFLVEGDFYAVEDQSPEDWDLAIRPFAWIVLLQAAELAVVSGGRLELTAAGRKALNQPPNVTLRAVWKKWLRTTLFDEFNRIDAIKGQKKARPTSAAGRRDSITEALEECTPGRWIAVDEFLRFVRASGRDFDVVRSEWELYLHEHYYGNFGMGSSHTWEQVQGRYAFAFLFEYAATLGLIDVAYIPPGGVRADFHDRWGTDEMSCLSRYDGLLYFRINPLGAWCLGHADHYEAEDVPAGPSFRVLPNLDVVSGEQAVEPADVLFLDRLAERTSQGVWHLDRDKILSAVESAFNLDDLERFLSSRSREPLPQTVSVLLGDLKQRAGKLRDLGTARIIECADAQTASLLIHDRELKKLCELAGERRLVFRAEDDAAVRNRIKNLGFIVPLRQ